MYESRILEETHAASILLYLYEKGRVNKGILAQELSKRSGTVAKRIDELVSAGLILETIEEKRSRPHNVELTPTGKRVAEKLAEIEEILGEEKEKS